MEEYKGQAIPLLIYLNNKGEEVDRVLGYYPPDEYLNIIQNIYNGIDTFLSLKLLYSENNKDIETTTKLAIKCADNREPDFCRDVYSTIINSNLEFEEDVIFKAELFFATEQLHSDNEKQLLELIEKYNGKEYISDAYQSIIQYYMINDKTELEAEIYKQYANQFNSNPSLLNGYAWRMSEIGINLDDALQKSNLAIDLIHENNDLKSYILDTKAELLWLLNRSKEAIDAINLAISINPGSDYFQEQKLKFKSSIKN